MSLAIQCGYDDHPHSRRRATHPGPGSIHPGRRRCSCCGGLRRCGGAPRGPPGEAGSDPPRRADAQAHRARGLPPTARGSGLRADPHRDADSGDPGGGSRPRPRGGCRRVPDQAVLAPGTPRPGRGPRAGDAVVAANVALSQALAYARDLRNLYEVTRAREAEIARAHDKLRAAYQQSLTYAVDLKKTHRRLQSSILQNLLGLANALEAKDEYTRGHSDRVAALARRLALAAGCGSREAATIAHAGLLHDLGKIAVPERILRKPGPLTDDEWSVMRRHPLTGAQIVAPLEFFADGALVVRHHHERHDGSGYPDGLAGATIPLGSRIVAIADVYDALTSNRPYRLALTDGQARERLVSEAGRTLDERLVAIFLDTVLDEPPDPSSRH